VADVTRPHGIPTVVSLNSLMVDGTGMCGGCRVQTSEGTRFACVDGPEFDAHAVDFENLAQRNRIYADAERAALQAFRERGPEEVAALRAGCRLAETHPEVDPERGCERP
jgi:ferredoxin--NADP+ reductase